jgi:excisionase family DNA binding protein
MGNMMLDGYVDYYTVEEVAEKARVSTKTVRNWIKCGRLKAHRIGRSYLIHIDDFDAAFVQVRPTVMQRTRY